MENIIITAANPREAQHRAIKEARGEQIAICEEFAGNLDNVYRCIKHDTKVLIVEGVSFPEDYYKIGLLLLAESFKINDNVGKCIYHIPTPKMIFCTTSRYIPDKIGGKVITIINV